jgi:hypothetical protein
MMREILKRFEGLVREGRMSSHERRLLEGQEILAEESFKILRGC